jgi:hypothetical protein
VWACSPILRLSTPECVINVGLSTGEHSFTESPTRNDLRELEAGHRVRVAWGGVAVRRWTQDKTPRLALKVQ